MNDQTDPTLKLAQEVAALADDVGFAVVVIGAAALAFHGYPRATEDVDLASFVNPFDGLSRLRRKLIELGYEVTLSLPDAEDPLGGVLTVIGEETQPVQIVNFLNPLAPSENPGQDAIDNALETDDTLALRVVDLAHLIALKLYAGGPKSANDALELLARNPDVSRDWIGRICQANGLGDEWTTLARSEGSQ